MPRLSPAVLLLLCGLAQQVAAQQYDLRVFSVEDGLPSATVRSVTEDGQGFLWLATDGGACRSEGRAFQTLDERQGAPGSAVSTLHRSSNNILWAGLADGGIAHWDGHRFIAFPGRLNARVRSLLVDEERRVWACDIEGHARVFTADGKLAQAFTDHLAHVWVNKLVADTNGDIWAGTDDGLLHYTAKAWHEVNESDGLPKGRILDLAVDSNDLLIGTTAGLVIRQGGHFAVLDSTSGLLSNRVQAVLEGRDGALWLGTPAGLVRILRRGNDPKAWRITTVTEANGLGHNDVRCLYQDRSGALWAGTAYGGVSKFVSSALAHVTERDGLRSRIVSAVRRTPDSTLWFGTFGGGVTRVEGLKVNNYGVEEGLSDLFVRTLWNLPSGEVIVGTEHSGAFVLRSGRFSPIAPMVRGRVNVIVSDPEGRIWVGGERGVVCDPGDHVGLAVGASINVNAIVSSGDSVWVGSDKGLHVINTRLLPWTMVPVAAVPERPITCLTRDVLGNLWIGTHGEGLLRLTGRTLQRYGTEQKLSSMYVEQVLLDAYQNLWVGTRQGVDLLEFDPMQEELLDVDHYGREEGLIGIETFRNACFLDVDSALWFGTVRGATRIDPSNAQRDEAEPITRISDITLFYQQVDWSPWCSGIDSLTGLPMDLVLPYDKNHLTFSFIGISLAYPEKVRYQFMLEGHDPDMSPIGATDRITYSNLAPGDYVFKVIARNASGIWNQQPAEFRFTIEPPLYRTTPFMIGAGSVLLLGFWGIVRLRTRRLRRESERLEHMVTERTQELEKEKHRSEELLLNILPEEVAEELKVNGRAAAHRFEHSTVLFSDFKGFTTFSSNMDSDTLVSELHHYFGLFDALCDAHGLEKIKTIGDAYMCAAGIPQPTKTHALDAVLMAFGMQEAVEHSNNERRAKGIQEWPIRIGMHTGPVVAGVVGTRKFAYDIWGDTVNLASRMESNGEAGMVNISGPVYAQVMEYVDVQPRGPIKVKGKGEMQMYFALRLKPQFSADAKGRVANDALLALRAQLLKAIA
ncbi:MAG: hypothetical protein IPN85_06445 [Flavobacteriales bacterium]|nr:hypothetical protein [Flavobacteriales bacterium]MBL0036706.1 hypothetical protein [Flavobacteriales bacterium]